MQKQSSTTAGQKLRQNRPLDRNIMKRQTCFCCGFAGHIARNCPNPPAVPVHAHHLKNLSKGDYAKRKPFRSGSNDSDWSANKTKTKILKTGQQIYVGESGPREGCPKMVRQKPSQRRPVNHRLEQKPTKKGKTNVSSSVVQPTRSDKRPKPIYRWVHKVPASKSSNHHVITSSILSDKQDMVWERVKQKDRNDEPGCKMDWVPKSN